MNSAHFFIFGILVVALGLGLRARRGKDMSLEQWSVGGRGFGTLIVFLLMAGEIFTTFVFLGGSGFAYGKGAAAFYLLGYGSLCFILSYWLLPPVWRYAKEKGLLSQPDFFEHESQTLGDVVAVVGVVALIPYLVLQLKGLGIIINVASYSSISSTQGIWVGAIIVALYVFVSGIHGSAWTAVVKDILVMFVAVFLGLYLPYHYYGGIGPMFEALNQAKPGFLALAPTGQSTTWYASTVLLSTLGFYMWPHTFTATFGGGDTIVSLLLMAYAFVTQLFPVLLMSLRKNNPVTRSAAIVRIVVGEATVAWVSLTKSTVGALFPFLPSPLQDLNVGIVALALNVITLVFVTLVTRKPESAGAQQVREA
ncbi:hypothetical protein AS026_38815 [Rhizobium altiplani]|uniref:Sodium:solute symporter n=1 Tax=Rhizobium altiplani TaxID=1864509 RepID=A0A109JTF9_9HYPH|nr:MULTISPECIES: hypothetical protein [Rhizobium]KWV54600.1 hypothetical protein AS026_38815 [Rhizobium altiplani]